MAHWICWAIASEREFHGSCRMVLVAAATFLANRAPSRLDVSSGPPARDHDRVGMALSKGLRTKCGS